MQAVRGDMNFKMKGIRQFGLSLLLCVALGVQTQAAGSAAPKLAPEKQALLNQMQEDISRQEAAYWAWRIGAQKDITLETLRSFSKHWIYGAEAKRQLLQDIERRVKAGRISPLKPEMRVAFDAAMRDLQSFYHGAPRWQEQLCAVRNPEMEIAGTAFNYLSRVRKLQDDHKQASGKYAAALNDLPGLAEIADDANFNIDPHYTKSPLYADHLGWEMTLTRKSAKGQEPYTVTFTEDGFLATSLIPVSANPMFACE